MNVMKLGTGGGMIVGQKMERENKNEINRRKIMKGRRKAEGEGAGRVGGYTTFTP